MTDWIAALPMYNVTPRHAALWRALLRDALDAFADAGGPSSVAVVADPAGDLQTLWHRNDLLLSQTCGYPYRMLGLADHVHLIATPAFDLPGCSGATYRSVLVVSAQAHARGATTLAACRGLHAVLNGFDSHSGMNAFRHAVAPHALEGRFFAQTTSVGSHLNALRALATGAGDLAAIDCVTLAYVRDALPELLHGLRTIGMTEAAPGLPFIASRALSDAHAALLRDALDLAHAADPARARELHLAGFVRLVPADYVRIEQFEDEARRLGYPALA